LDWKWLWDVPMHKDPVTPRRSPKLKTESFQYANEILKTQVA